MKKILLIGLLSLCGASLLAMKAPDYKVLLNDALVNPTDNDKAMAFVDAVKGNTFDLDSKSHTYYKKQTYYMYIDEQFKTAAAADSDLQKRAEGFLKDLQNYRSAPARADDLRLLVKDAEANPAKLADLIVFLNDKCFNIDLIPYDTAKPNETIAYFLDPQRLDDANIRNILKLDRIKLFRTKPVDPQDTLRDLIEDTLADDKNLVHFAAHYTDMLNKAAKAAAKADDVDVDKIPMNSGETIGEFLDNALAQKVVNQGALQIAELVQDKRDRTVGTAQALFKAFELDVTNASLLIAWLKNHPEDVDKVAYEAGTPGSLGAKLDGLVASADAATKAAAISVANAVRAHREAEIKAFKDKLEDYKKDKTKLDALKKWFEEHPFDIDVVAHDAAAPKGKTLGDIVNECNDAALSELFKATRTKAPQPAKSGLFSTRNLVIAVLAVGGYFLYKHFSQQNDDKESKAQLPAHS